MLMHSWLGKNLPLLLGQTWYPSLFLKFSQELPISARELCLILLAGLVKFGFRQSLTSNLSLDLVAYKDREFQAPSSF